MLNEARSIAKNFNDSKYIDVKTTKDITKFLLENLESLTRFSKSTITIEDIENLRQVEIRKEEFAKTTTNKIKR